MFIFLNTPVSSPLMTHGQTKVSNGLFILLSSMALPGDHGAGSRGALRRYRVLHIFNYKQLHIYPDPKYYESERRSESLATLR